MKEHRFSSLTDHSEKVQQAQQMLHLSDKIRQSIVLSNISIRQRNSQWVKGQHLYGKVKRSIEIRTKYCTDSSTEVEDEQTKATFPGNNNNKFLTIDTLPPKLVDRRRNRASEQRYTRNDRSSALQQHDATDPKNQCGRLTQQKIRQNRMEPTINPNERSPQKKSNDKQDQFKTIEAIHSSLKHRSKGRSTGIPYILQTRSENDRKKYEMINKKFERAAARINFEMSFLERRMKRTRESLRDPIFFESTVREGNFSVCLNTINPEQ